MAAMSLGKVTDIMDGTAGREEAPGSMSTRQQLLAAAVSLGLMSAAVPAAAYVPQVFNASQDTGQDFTSVPTNTAWNASNGINRKVWNNIFWSGSSPQFWFAGATGLWITSQASLHWPNTGMMQQDNSCAAGFGFGDFHWRSAIGGATQGPGANEIMWPADGDPAWPGIIKGSDDNHIGEVDVLETNYAANDTEFATFHFFNALAAGNDGTIMHLPVTFPAGSGDMTAMHDYDIVWGPGSMVLKVDGVVQMSAPPTQVRNDYAHGGCNYTLGAQEAMQATGYDKAPTVELEIANMWWSATDGSAGSGTSVPLPTNPAPVGPGAASPAPTTYAPVVTSPAAAGLIAGQQTVTGTGADPAGKLILVWQNNGTPTSGVTATVSSGGSFSASVLFDHPGTAGKLWLSEDGGPYVAVYSATPAATPPAVTPPVTSPVTQPTAPAAPAPGSSGALSITSIGYSDNSLNAVVEQTAAGGINLLVDGRYEGVERDTSSVGSHHLGFVFSHALAAGAHVATYYINGAQGTTAVNGNFAVP